MRFSMPGRGLAENAQDVGALLGLADRRAAHPGAGVERLGIAEEKVEPLPGPHLAPVARPPQRRRIVEGGIARHRPADHADQLRAGLLAGIERERVAGLARFERRDVAGRGAQLACGQARSKPCGRHDPETHAPYACSLSMAMMRVVPDSAPQVSPGRPASWRTLAPDLSDGKETKVSVLGSKRTTESVAKSVSHTASRSST